MTETKPRVTFRGRTPAQVIEAELSWIASLVLFFATVYALLKFDILWVVFGVTALTLYVLPILRTRDPFRALPWEMTLLVVAPIVLHFSENSAFLTSHLAWWDDFTYLAFAFGISTIGLLLALEVRMYTSVRMNRPFSVFFVIMFTIGVSGFWQVGIFFSDLYYNTNLQGTNADAMDVLVWNLVGGLIMGLFFDLYLGVMPDKRLDTLGIVHPHGWRAPR